MIKATFRGRNGSMGFYTGYFYMLRTAVEHGLIVVESVHCGSKCWYSNVETFLANWKLEE